MPEMMKLARGACPAFFRAACWEASQGGSRTYRNAGSSLAAHLASLEPWDDANVDWEAEIVRLDQLLAVGATPAIIGWFAQHLPRCLALVPPRRRHQFVQGLHDYLEEEGLGLVDTL